MTGPATSSEAESSSADARESSEASDRIAAIDVQHLTHTYPQRRRRGADDSGSDQPRPALDDVSFSVEPGEIFGILGPNGGGKTTLFRILSTIMRPSHLSDDTRIHVLGHDLLTEAHKVRQSLGVVFQAPSLDGKLNARENMTHQGHLYGLRGAELQKRIDQWMDYFGLKDRQDEVVERFSGGMRRRVELAKALLHEPPLLLLDEPSSGLDPGARADLWAQLDKLRDSQQQTVALTTHLMEEADRCDRLAVLSAGKLVTVDTPENLKAQIGGDVITVTARQEECDLNQLCNQISQKFGPWEDRAAPNVIDKTIYMEKADGPVFVADLAQHFGEQLGQISVGRPTLEDVFLHLTGHTLWQDDKDQ